jgi:hypothetical protein
MWRTQPTQYVPQKSSNLDVAHRLLSVGIYKDLDTNKDGGLGLAEMSKVPEEASQQARDNDVASLTVFCSLDAVHPRGDWRELFR